MLRIRVEKYSAGMGPVLGNSQYIRGVAFNTFKKKGKTGINGKMVINGPLNINHKPVIQLVNLTSRDEFRGTDNNTFIKMFTFLVYHVVKPLINSS